MKQATDLDYTERAQLMTQEQRSALHQTLSDKFKELKILASQNEFAVVRGVNVAREIGQQVELFTGHEKLLPGEFKTLSVSIPDATLEFAKTCLALHHRYPSPLANYRQAAPEWERLLVQLELLPKGQRLAAKSTHLSEPVKDYVATVIKVAQESIALEKKIPMEQWDGFLLRDFVTQMKPLHDQFIKAEKLAATK